jgi:hypothetical protein
MLVDSTEDPTSVSIIASALDRLNISERARMLGRLLASVGPLGLAVVAGGAFAKYVTQSRLPDISVSIEDAAHTTRSQLSDVVRYIQQSDPQLFRGLLALIGCCDSKPDETLRDWSQLAAEPC